MPEKSISLTGAIQEISRFALFHELSFEQLQELCEGGIVKVHQHREVVFHAGEKATHFGVVLSGAYKLSRVSHEGEDAVIHFCSPGDVLAALIMPQPNPSYPLTAKAMGPSRVLMIPREVYLKKWVIRSDLVMRIQNLFSSRMSRFQNHRVMERAPLASKIAALLLQLSSKEAAGHELEIPLPLTRKEIADSLGVTVESVIRVMSKWSKGGLILTTDQQIKIIKPDLLVQEVNE